MQYKENERQQETDGSKDFWKTTIKISIAAGTNAKLIVI